MNAQQPYLTLNNGVRMPQVGLGLYMIQEGDEAYIHVGCWLLAVGVMAKLWQNEYGKAYIHVGCWLLAVGSSTVAAI